MTAPVPRRSSRVTGVRIALLSVLWIAVALLTAPGLGFYYEALAVWCTVPVLALTYLYCLWNRRRETAILAVVATAVAVLVIGFAIVFPKGSAA